MLSNTLALVEHLQLCATSPFCYNITTDTLNYYSSKICNFSCLSGKFVYTFLSGLIKSMKSTIIQVLHALQERGEATRPQLAQATGISSVTIGRIMEELQKRGEAIAMGEIPSGGGRPVQLYRFNSKFSYNAVIRLTREGTQLHGELEELDLNGIPVTKKEGRFSYIDRESFDGWLDALNRKHRLNSITLSNCADIPKKELIEHLQHRYQCRVYTPSDAALLATRREGITTLYLPQGGEPSCVYYRHNKLHECGNLSQLPLPTEWQSLDYTDRTLQEEMVARLLLIINCIIAPNRIYIIAPNWNTRLTERIRYNLSTKVKGNLPTLRFITLPHHSIQSALREYASSITKEQS